MKGKKDSPFENVGIMKNREVTTLEAKAKYDGPILTLGEILLDDKEVPEFSLIKEVKNQVGQISGEMGRGDRI